MACEPNDLINLARCFSCLSPATLLEIQTYLLCQIWQAGGTGGGGGQQEVFGGPGGPTENPEAGVEFALWINTTTNEMSQWYGGAWH